MEYKIECVDNGIIVDTGKSTRYVYDNFEAFVKSFNHLLQMYNGRKYIFSLEEIKEADPSND